MAYLNKSRKSEEGPSNKVLKQKIVFPLSIVFSKKSFTLVELVIVVIIVGLLAALGLSQYEQVVEKSRLAGAKVRIGVMRTLAYQYYMENSSIDDATNEDMGVNDTCSSTDFYSYHIYHSSAGEINLTAERCTSGGKSPNSTRGYAFYMMYWPASGQNAWHCIYRDTSASCFGFPS